jgi:hypothetical protein
MSPETASVTPSAHLLVVDAKALLSAQADGRWQSFDLSGLLHQPVEVVLTALATHNGPSSHSAQLLAAWLAEDHRAMMQILTVLTTARHATQHMGTVLLAAQHAMQRTGEALATVPLQLLPPATAPLPAQAQTAG